MRYLLLPILALLLALPANAAELLIIQSHSNQQYDQTVRLLQNSCAKKNQTYIMGDYAEFDLGRIVREEQPRVVIAVGDKPLKESQKLRGTQVLYTMALTANEETLRNNITGISMHAAPEHYLKLLQKLKLRRVGIIYSKAKSGAYIERTKSVAPGYGVELVTIQVKSPQEVAAALARLSGSGIDSIWMIPDTTAVTAESVNSYFLHGQSANLPIISFSRSYLEKGALAAVEASRSKMNDQLCNSVRQLLAGTKPADIPVTDIAEASLYTNDAVAMKLNLSVAGADKLFPPDRK